MATTTPRAARTEAAPWRADFLEHLSKMKPPEFVLSTLHAAPKGSPTPYLPRARYCVFRGFWAELPENKHNEAPQNERVYESDLPTFTTDVRMDKVSDLFGSSAGHGSPSQSHGSGGGGPIEAVWWAKDDMTQWRVRGEAYVVGPDIEGSGEESSGVRTVKSIVGSRMRIVKEGETKTWSWTRELDAHFGNCSPGMRGSFKAPPPGTPSSNPPPSKEMSLGQKLTNIDDPIARENFRVVIIKPSEVESLEIADPSTARRRRWTFVGDTEDGTGKNGIHGGWTEEELWP
ncbi:MAG: hypothetical protein M1819_005447 [Sarea resinae]|nr:MAG: hypothetical protein M1819_005447 [Sarea resinae]